jgi:hypothetical protein
VASAVLLVAFDDLGHRARGGLLGGAQNQRQEDRRPRDDGGSRLAGCRE